MSKVKSCLLCENYKTHRSECEHCENWNNFHISESGKALREKIYGDGYQDGHKDGYDKGYDDAQANNNRPQGKWIKEYKDFKCSLCGKIAYSWNNHGTYIQIKSDFCPHCGADMRVKNELGDQK